MKFPRLVSFSRDEQGGVLIIGALALPVIIGIAALVAEYGYGLVNKVENQRVADLAAYAGAVAFSTKKSEADMRSAAGAVAGLNGIAADKLTVRLVKSPRTEGSNAVNVIVRTSRPLFLARILNPAAEMKIAAGATAEVGSTAAPAGCVLALDPTQTGVTLSGGTALNAPKCVVSSNAAVTVPCGTSITALGVNYNAATAPSQPCGGIKGPNGAALTPVKAATPDPLAENAAVKTAAGRIATVRAMQAIKMATVKAGTDISFGWDQNATRNQATALGCTATWAQPLWTLNCGTKTVIDVGNVTVGGGINVDWNLGGKPTVVYNFSGSINNTGSVMRFPSGVYNVAKGVITGGGTTTSFGAGTFRIGMADVGCNGNRYSVCNTSTLTFGGPSTFELAGGFATTGDRPLTLGSGTTNSYKLGPGSGGDAIRIEGSAKAILAAASGNNSYFEVVGNVFSGGGSCFVVPAALHHDIAGNFNASGGIDLGAGIYTIDGFFAAGANGGGSVSCNGTTISVRGIDVSLVLSGKATPPSGSCSGYAFCVAAGYSGIRLAAPTSGSTAKLAVIGPQVAGITAGATFAEGGSGGTVSGAFYFPKGPLTMTGGAGVSGNDSYCFQLIASRITLSGGTTAASECIASAGSGTASKVALVE